MNSDTIWLIDYINFYSYISYWQTSGYTISMPSTFDLLKYLTKFKCCQMVFVIMLFSYMHYSIILSNQFLS